MSKRPCESPPKRHSAKVFDFDRFACAVRPRPNIDYQRYNGDLTIDHYAPSAIAYSGAQRKGVADPPPGALDCNEHIEIATNALFPTYGPIPLPSDIRIALEFSRGNLPQQLTEFSSSSYSACA